MFFVMTVLKVTGFVLNAQAHPPNLCICLGLPRLLKIISSHFVCEEHRLTTSLLLPFLFLSLLCLCVGQYERFIFCVPAPFGCHICLKSLIRAFKHLIINSLLFRLLLGLSLASLSLHQKKKCYLSSLFFTWFFQSLILNVPGRLLQTKYLVLVSLPALFLHHSPNPDARPNPL